MNEPGKRSVSPDTSPLPSDCFAFYRETCGATLTDRFAENTLPAISEKSHRGRSVFTNQSCQFISKCFSHLFLKKKGQVSLSALLFCNEIMLHTELPCITIHPLPAAELCSNTWRITRRESDCYLLSLLRMSEFIPQLISTRCSADANCTTAHDTMRRDVKALKMYHTQQRMFSSR